MIIIIIIAVIMYQRRKRRPLPPARPPHNNPAFNTSETPKRVERRSSAASVYEEPGKTQPVLYDMMRVNSQRAEDRRSGVTYEEIDESISARPRLETKWNRDAPYAALDGGHGTYASSKSTYAGLDNHKMYGDSKEN